MFVLCKIYLKNIKVKTIFRLYLQDFPKFNKIIIQDTTKKELQIMFTRTITELEKKN